LGRKRKERDKVYHLIERFGLRSEVRAIELGGWRMEWGDFRLQSGIFNGKSDFTKKRSTENPKNITRILLINQQP
jgi:hypothetical protein